MDERKSIAIASNSKKAIRKLKAKTNYEILTSAFIENDKQKFKGDWLAFNKFKNFIKENKKWKQVTNAVFEFSKFKKKTLKDFQGVWVFKKHDVWLFEYSNSTNNKKFLTKNDFQTLENLYDAIQTIENIDWNKKQYIDLYWLIKTWYKSAIIDKNSIGKVGLKIDLKNKIAFESAVTYFINWIIDWKLKSKSISKNIVWLKFIEKLKSYKDFDCYDDIKDSVTNDFEYINASSILENLNSNWKIDKLLTIQKDIDWLKKTYKLKLDKSLTLKDYKRKLASLLVQKKRLIDSFKIDCYL